MNSPSIWDAIKKRAKWLLLSPVIFALPLAIPFLILNLLNSDILIWVPFNLHSVMAADYSADPRGFRIGQLDFRIIGEIFQDHGDDNYGEHLATIQASLLTPVATVTPYPGMQITALPSPTQTPTISTPTNIPGGTQLTPTATLSPSSTPTLAPSATVRATVFYPTATKTTRPTSKPTQPPKATATKKPPPPTPKPPTATSVPATKPPKPYPAPTDPPYP